LVRLRATKNYFCRSCRDLSFEVEGERAVQLDSGAGPDSPDSGPEHSAPLAIARVAKKIRNFGQSPMP